MNAYRHQVCVQDAIVIGAGQAGLAAGYYLQCAGLRFSILDAGKVGESWTRRWDSLRLFTPARYNSLPGMKFPGKPYDLPSKDEVAAYLHSYVARFELPVREHASVASLKRQDGNFTVTLHSGEKLFARTVIVATGANQRPYTPALSGSIAPQVLQLHSNQYRSPAQLPDGRVLVVGAGNSGAQIALELADSGREVVLAGPQIRALPRRFLGRDLYDWLWHTLLRTTSESARGRHIMQARRFAADPLIGLSPKAFARLGLIRKGRVVSTWYGMPVIDDGSALFDLAAIIWCTGFRPDYSWIELPIFGLDGYPKHHRGVATEVHGLGFVGMRYQHRIRSALLGGVGEDAAHVVSQISTHLRESGLATSTAHTELVFSGD